MTDPYRVRIENLAEYQEGSVVSSTLIDKKEGSVTAFAFAKGQGLSEHTAPFDTLVQIIDGEATVSIEGTEYTMEKGEMIMIPANVAHSMMAIESFKMVLIMIRA